MKMSSFFNYLFGSLVILAIRGRYAGALECYNCGNVNSVNTCTTTTHCANGQSCYLNVSSNGYRLGCIDNQQCGGLSNVAGQLVGRSLTTNDSIDHPKDDLLFHLDITTRENPTCLECCSAEICNKHLCEHLKPTACIDDFKVDCALMNSIFSICKNIHEAKAVCPKFCGLCSLVDGNWADWSNWSVCDVTCGTGTQTRTRTCTNPTPVAGGLECQGSANETKICSLHFCPVDGVWTEWASWSTCDVSCGNGTRTRTRSCSNPSPAYHGQNCPGSTVDTTLCVKDVCPVHGGWTQWFSWEPCSVTCDYGIQRRLRNCTNPTPERFGDHCFGQNMDDRICQPGPCANGGWSDWGSWSSCSTTCGGGMKSRSRTCSNPHPSAAGLQCEGNPQQYVSCNNDRCLSPSVVFRSKNLQNTTINRRRLVFTTPTLNFENGYNGTTGIFTAPVPGTYSFSVQLCVLYPKENYASYAITQNGIDITNSALAGNDVLMIHICDSFGAITVLRANDMVWVRISNGRGYFVNDDEYLNIFSGMLVHD